MASRWHRGVKQISRVTQADSGVPGALPPGEPRRRGGHGDSYGNCRDLVGMLLTTSFLRAPSVSSVSPWFPGGGRAPACAGDDRSDAGPGGSARETTNRASEPTDRAPSGRVERRSRHSGFGSRRTDSSAGVLNPDESSRASEQARGPPKPAYDSRSGRFEPRRRQPGAGAGGRTAEQTAPDAERPNAPAEEAARRLRQRSRAASRHPPAGATNFRPPQPIRWPEQTDSRPSSQIHTRAATRRVRAVESVSVHRPQFSNDHSVLPFKATLQRRTALAHALLLIGPARPRIFIEHAMFRPWYQDSARCSAPRPRSRVQGLAHVMHLMPRDRVISPREARSFEVHHDAGGVAPRDAGPSGVRTRTREV